MRGVGTRGASRGGRRADFCRTFEPAYARACTLHVPFPFSYGAQVRASTTIVHNGVYYRYDPRLVIFNNTVDAPANLSSLSGNVHGRNCPLLLPSAPKTMLNEHSCVITHGCSPDEYQVHRPTTRLRHQGLLSVSVLGTRTS